MIIFTFAWSLTLLSRGSLKRGSPLASCRVCVKLEQTEFSCLSLFRFQKTTTISDWLKPKRRTECGKASCLLDPRMQGQVVNREGWTWGPETPKKPGSVDDWLPHSFSANRPLWLLSATCGWRMAPHKPKLTCAAPTMWGLCIRTVRSPRNEPGLARWPALDGLTVTGEYGPITESWPQEPALSLAGPACPQEGASQTAHQLLAERNSPLCRHRFYHLKKPGVRSGRVSKDKGTGMRSRRIDHRSGPPCTLQNA